jgi:putative intracellular protease/amidase
MARVLVPLPDRDFDVTEVAVPWKLLTTAGHEIVFATENGNKPAADPLLLTGVLFGRLGAEPEPRAFYEALEEAPAFLRPLAWRDVDVSSVDAMILPGGHAKGMRQYLEADELFAKVGAFVRTGKPLGAICHGVLVLARTKDSATGRSVLAARRTTCLPKYMERSAWLATAWKLGSYYRTYDEYVEDEVRAALDAPDSQFVRGPRVLFRRGTNEDDSAAFVVEDANYVSARWPGDAYLFARRILARLERLPSRT